MKKAAQADFPAFEAEMLKAWEIEKTFEASLKNREGAKRYSFYDGPPFANGLPLEFAIEKEFGVSGKKQILELGLAKFNEACRLSVFKYKEEWEEFFRRIGRWTDTENAYVTMDRNYTESVWWMLGQVQKKTDTEGKSLLYKGYKSMPYCPRCETPLSNFEVNEGYKDDVPDPSLYVKFKLVGEDASLLGWTTTPWSLSGNGAVALHPNEKYVYVQTEEDDEVLVLAEKRLDALKGDSPKVLKTVSAKELEGKSYEPLYKLDNLKQYEGHENLYKVRLNEHVSIEDGTGVLHVAAAYGEDDLAIGQENGFPVLQTVDASGHVKPGMGLDTVEGKFFKGADKLVIEDLTERGRVYAAETFTHTYPFCYRCDTPLLYYAISTWFVGVSKLRDELKATAAEINWQPSHIKNGRFGKWLDGARDWAISRNRYWGAPMPIWVNEADENDYIVVESLDELVKLAGLEGKPEDLHRPMIDEVVIRTTDGQTHDPNGKVYKRIEEVFDCWFESGSMPVAQQHFPFENKTVFEESFPADYIGEGLDQTRLWFYVLHVLNTIAFGKPAYKNVLVNGMVMAADGQKLSKRLKNYPPVEEVFALEGADTLRFYLLGNDQAVSADYMRFNRDAMRDIQRNVFGTLWNTYSFLSMYAEIDGWNPRDAYAGGKLSEPVSQNVLDQWMLARLNQVTGEVTEAADAYALAKALRPLRELVDDLSNWYVRRSRRRFWKSEDDGDKASAYVTLHYTLCRIAQLLAPWTPFVADKLWRGLTEGMEEATSVHLSDWPKAGKVDDALLGEMSLARDAITLGLAKRAEAKIKVRQPLAKATLRDVLNPEGPNFKQLRDVIAEELNVKSIVVKASGDPDHVVGQDAVMVDTEITPELAAEGMMRDVVRHIQNARKETGLEVDDRIVLTLETESKELAAAIAAHADVIKAETLATELKTAGASGQVPVKVNGEKLYIVVRKA